jgi:hypothetical protein
MAQQMNPVLILADLRHPATVERWLTEWQTTRPQETHTLVILGAETYLDVGYTTNGIWYTVTGLDLDHSETLEHEDRAALVEHVTAWAKGLVAA